VTTVPSTTASTTPATTARDCPAGGPAEHDPFGRIEAESYDAQQGVTRRATPGGQACQVTAGNGDHVMFLLDFDESLATRVEAHVASGVPAGADVVLEARLDAADSPPFATIHVTNSGGWTSFTTLSDDTSAAIGGVHAVYVTVTSSPGEGADAVAVDWFRFQP
jgi:Carbohydrate binding module (family 6)